MVRQHPASRGGVTGVSVNSTGAARGPRQKKKAVHVGHAEMMRALKVSELLNEPGKYTSEQAIDIAWDLYPDEETEPVSD